MQPFDMPHDVRVTEMSWPTKIVFGAGALKRLPAQVARLKMKRPLVVTDAGVVKAGLAQRVYDDAEGRGRGVRGVRPRGAQPHGEGRLRRAGGLPEARL